ncbi:DUF2841 domain-containing protein [Aspergillus thermomutatus]|uniref:Subtelomeric hrmA-associated cluster protein AFUB-079030/YDR124W-like helical bundle domain-containing protein n=1 Tax=Aspergillus thermomutatus TaxID=41047 RepID=A0A397GCJ6_ASPTH|nr:uncharacterized protein CDV56_104719 [Aspergillus thermomutatus]RHZ48752.1 hypothetical protein CDV56_104719 [Aspergillus thermomutatus]
MATNNSSTQVQGSTKRSSHENPFTKLENMDKDGAVKATGSDLVKGTHSWFIQDLCERFQDILPAKRCRASVDDSDKQKAAVDVLPECSNTQQVTDYYWQTFSSILQGDIRRIGQAWIGLIEPNKPNIHPYNRGANAKPKWWPDGVRHESPHHLHTNERVPLLIHILRMSGKGKITCVELQEAAVQKTAVSKTQARTLKILNEIIAMRKNEEKGETRCDNDSITATGAQDEKLNCGLIQVSRLASDEGRGVSSVGSPKGQIEEIFPSSPSGKYSPGFPSSYPSTSEAPANPMYYHGSPEDQIEEISPTSPSGKSSPGFTPSSYPSTSETPANLMYYRGSQYQTPYPVSQSINFRARVEACKQLHDAYRDRLAENDFDDQGRTWLERRLQSIVRELDNLQNSVQGLLAQDAKDKGIGDMILAEVQLEDPSNGYAPAYLSHRPAGAVLVDLAVLPEHTATVRSKYLPVNFSPFSGDDPLVCSQPGDDIDLKRALAFRRVLSRYDKAQRIRQSRGQIPGSENELISNWFSSDDKTVHPDGAILVDLAVHKEGVRRVLRKYGVIDFVPMSNEDPVVLSQPGDIMEDKQIAAYEDMLESWNGESTVGPSSELSRGGKSRLFPITHPWEIIKKLDLGDVVREAVPLENQISPQESVQVDLAVEPSGISRVRDLCSGSRIPEIE